MSKKRKFQIIRVATPKLCESKHVWTQSTSNKQLHWLSHIKQVKSQVRLGKKILMTLHLRATRCHLPYGITQCYLPPDTSEHILSSPQPARQAGTRFANHLRMEGWVSPGPGCKEQLAHGCSQRNSISELRGVTCHMESYSVTCHPTQVNTPRLNPSQTGRYSIFHTQVGLKAELS